MRARLPVVETAEPTADVLARTDPEHEERERLGAALRAARAERGLSLRDVAEAAEISASMVSQLEAGKTSPSLSTLRRLAAALGRPVAAFFVEPDGQASPAPPARHGHVVRRHERKHLHLPASRLKYELLSPNLSGRIEFLWSEFSPGQPETGFGSHPGEEAILVLKGALDVWVADEHHRLQAGDAITFDSSIAHRVRNPGPGTCEKISAITPPEF